MQSASIGVWVRTGGRYERPGQAGVPPFLEHLLFKGTRTRGCETLKRAIEGVGGSLNGFTAEEFTCYMAKVPAAYLKRGITILGDMVLQPALAPRSIEKEREVILEEIGMYEDTPGQHVHDLFNQMLFPNHPLGNILSGTEDTVKALSASAIRAHWRRFYHPRHLLVAVAGAFDPDETLAQIRHAFGRADHRGSERSRPAPRTPRGPQVRLLHKTAEQTHLCLGTPAIGRLHPLRFAVEVLHVLLGGNMSSRLFHEVREKRGLAYEIGTHIKRYRDAGAFVVYAGCEAQKLPQTVETILEQLGTVRRALVPPRELRRTKDFYAGQLMINLEDTMEQMLWMGEQAMTVGSGATPEDVIHAIEGVTAEQVRRAARQLFTARQIFMAVVGPVPEHEREQLRKLCEVLN